MSVIPTPGGATKSVNKTVYQLPVGTTVSPNDLVLVGAADGSGLYAYPVQILYGSSDCCPTTGPVIYPIRRFAGANLGARIQAAIDSVPAGSTIDCQGAFQAGIPLTITAPINITKQITILLGSYTITATPGAGNNVFNIKTSGVRIIGNGSSTKIGNEHGPTRVVMTNGNLHVYAFLNTSTQVASTVIKDLDLIGVISTYYKYLPGTLTPKNPGTRTFNLDGCGGILISEPNPYLTGQGNNTSKNIIDNVFVSKTQHHGISIIGGVTTLIQNCRLSSCSGHGIFIDSGTTTSTLINNYVSSAVLAGIKVKDSSSVALIGNGTDECGIGLFLRACTSCTVINHYAELCRSRSLDYMPWRTSVTLGNGTQLGGTIGDISNSSNTVGNLYNGTSIVVSGGQNISIENPYSKDAGAPSTGSNAWSITQSSTYDARHYRICRGANMVRLNNPYCKVDQSTNPYTSGDAPRFDIGVEASGDALPQDVMVYFNPKTGASSFTRANYVLGNYSTYTDTAAKSTTIIDESYNINSADAGSTLITSGTKTWPTTA